MECSRPRCRCYELLLVVVLCVPSLRHSCRQDFIGPLLLLESFVDLKEGVHLSYVIDKARDADVYLLWEWGR